MKKRLIRIGVGVVLLCVAAVGLLCLKGKGVLAQKIAELKAQGLPTTFAELETKYKLPEGTANAADIYVKAFAAYRPLADVEKQNQLPVMGNQADPNDDEPYPPKQMAAAVEFVEQNQAMFALLHEAGKVEKSYYPMDYSLGADLRGNILYDIKQVVQSLSIAGIYYSCTNQPQKAYEAAMDHLRLGQSLSNNPGLINHLVQVAMLGIGVSNVREIINRTSLDENQLLQLQKFLQHISKATTLSPALHSEICYCLEYKNIVRNLPMNRWAMNERAKQYAAALLPKNMTMVLEAYQRMIEIDQLPVQEQLPKVCEIVKEATDASAFIFMPKITLPSMKIIFTNHLRVRANMDCAITALGVERYRLKEGKLPETVDDLVPGYLPQVYLDPFDGRPLRYKRTEPGYMVYTIGEDGVDDGGRAQDPNDRKATYDWVFRVYR
jgi:hypothetical protein